MRRFLSAGLSLLLGCLLAAPSPTSAQPTDLAGFSFLTVEPSARAAALGGAFSAVYDGDVNGLFYNPALLDETTHRSLAVSYLNHVSDLNLGFAAFGYHREGLGTFGAGLRFLTWSGLDGADATGAETGSFGASDAALTLSFARAYDARLRYGVSVHGILSSVDAFQASALALDAGVLYHVPERLLSVSASLHHLGVVLSSLGSATDDELPLDLRLSVAKRLRYLPLQLSVTGYDLTNPGSDLPGSTAVDDLFHHLAFGGEFQFSEAFQLRVGYNHRRHEALKTKTRLDLAGFGAGFGLRLARLRIDYAFNSWSSLGGLHQFSLQTNL